MEGGASGRGKGYKRSAPASSIDRFFTKLSKPSHDGDGSSVTNVVISSSSTSVPAASECNSEGDGLPATVSSAALPSSSSSANEAHFEVVEAEVPLVNPDIGEFLDKIHGGKVDDFTRCKLLKDSWAPPEKYDFPHSIHRKCDKEERRYVGHQHLRNYHWLVLSHSRKGLFCKYCVLFAPSLVGHHHGAEAGALVSRPLIKFSKLSGKSGDLEKHANSLYHKQAVEAGKMFLLSYHKPHLDVANQVDAQRLEQVKENRARLKQVVDAIILCGRRNIPLRGHRDTGSVLDTPKVEDGSLVSDDGNFREILRYSVASGNKVLEEHLKNPNAGATYISGGIQNELIDCCGKEIQFTLLERVRAANWFSIIFDETSDIAHMEQMSISFRYVHNKTIREDFFTFLDAYDQVRFEDIHNGEKKLTGEALGHIVVDLCKKNSLDLLKCVGVGTDNCSVMASDIKGAVHEIQKTAINAKRCPCFNHSLNNSLKQSNSVMSCKTATAKMKEVIAFSHASAKISGVFKDFKAELTGLCETRWQEKHDGVLQFQNKLKAIIDALDSISNWQSSDTSSKASSLASALADGEFIVTLFAMSDILSSTSPLSRLLQTPSLCMQRATAALNDTLTILRERREDAEKSFHEIFLKAQDLAEAVGVTIVAPRVARRQVHRANHPSVNVEEYFRRAVFIPLLDNTLGDLSGRLPEATMQLFELRLLLPSVVLAEGCTKATLTRVAALEESYKGVLGDSMGLLCSEYRLWHAQWTRIRSEGGTVANDCLAVLDQCDEDLYSNIRSLLLVLATLPVSVATAERSFSTLRRIKTWLRSRMGEDRLVGLALMNVHKGIPIDIENVINMFAKQKHRKVEFLL